MQLLMPCAPEKSVKETRLTSKLWSRSGKTTQPGTGGGGGMEMDAIGAPHTSHTVSPLTFSHVSRHSRCLNAAAPLHWQPRDTTPLAFFVSMESRQMRHVGSESVRCVRVGVSEVVLPSEPRRCGTLTAASRTATLVSAGAGSEREASCGGAAARALALAGDTDWRDRAEDGSATVDVRPVRNTSSETASVPGVPPG